MSEAFGPDFITVTDEDGNEFELELIDSLEHNGITYHALFPAVGENEETGEPLDVDADDEEYGLVIMKTIEENGEELLDLFEKTRPEVVFMDVEMPGMTGVECARLIQDKNPKTIMVFVTAHEEYMADAFEVYAFDYLLKPFRMERAMHTLDLIRQRLRESAGAPGAPEKPVRFNAPARIMLKHREGVSFVDLNDILLVQREERATVVYVADGGRFVTGDTLGEMEERLPEGNPI